VIPARVHLGLAIEAGDVTPPRDLGGGIWAAPPWFIIAFGAVIAVGAIAAVIGRSVYAKRKREQDERGPRSRRRW
jgi:hypothetical protein